MFRRHGLSISTLHKGKAPTFEIKSQSTDAVIGTILFTQDREFRFFPSNFGVAGISQEELHILYFHLDRLNAGVKIYGL